MIGKVTEWPKIGAKGEYGFIECQEAPRVFFNVACVDRESIDKIKPGVQVVFDAIEHYENGWRRALNVRVASADQSAGSEEGALSEELRNELEELFSAGRYAEVLTSGLFDHSPRSIPVKYYEMALTCAKRLLFPGTQDFVRLNRFQTELIYHNNKSGAFAEKWRACDDPTQMMRECGETAFVRMQPNVAEDAITRLMDRCCQVTNENLSEVTKRFARAKNSLYSYFVLMEIFSADKLFGQPLKSYCEFIATLKSSDIPLKMDARNRLLLLPEIVACIRTNILGEAGEAFPFDVSITVATTFVDMNLMDRLKDVVSLMDPDAGSFINRLAELYPHCGAWSEAEFADFVKSGDTDLIGKALSGSQDWNAENAPLPIPFLRCLSWLLKYCDAHTFEQVLDSCLDSKLHPELRKPNKIGALLGSFGLTCSVAQRESDAWLYCLAGYIVQNLYSEDRMKKIPEEYSVAFRQWPEFSEAFFGSVGTLTEKSNAEWGELFFAFRFDPAHQERLQSEFCCRYLAQHPLEESADMEPQRISAMLDELCLIRADKAFCAVYTYAERHGRIADPANSYFRHYLTILMEQRDFKSAVKRILDRDSYEAGERGILLGQCILGNFRVNGLSEVAFSLLEDDFPIESIESILLNGLTDGPYAPEKLAIIASLMAIYFRTKNFERTVYLYSVFSQRVKKRNAWLLGQLEHKLTINLNGMRSFFNALTCALISLPSDRVLPFFKWASMIPTPEDETDRVTTGFELNYQAILLSPEDPVVWQRFVRFLSNRPIQNARLLCACSRVCAKLLGRPVEFDLKNYLCGYLVPEQMPYASQNYIPYAMDYIMETRDVEFCYDLQNALEQRAPDNRSFLSIVKKHQWWQTYTEELAIASKWAIKQAVDEGELAYCKLLASLGCLDLNLPAVRILAATEFDKGPLLAFLCRDFIAHGSDKESAALAKKDGWYDLSAREARVLDVIGLLHTDAERLCAKDDVIFPTVETVERCKADCATILSSYPKKDGLLAFNDECFDVSHRLRVYSILFDIIYDESIYKKNFFSYDEFEDQNTFLCYAAFLDRAFQAQLDTNITYRFFYKEWRYLKLALVRTLRWGKCVVDPEIVALMERYHHAEIVKSSYLAFQKDVTAFLSISAMEEKVKHNFLLSLTQGQMGTFLREHDRELAELPQEAKERCRRLIEYLDYREVNYKFFARFRSEIRSRRLELPMKVAEALSDYAYDTIRVLEKEETFEKYSATFDVYSRISASFTLGSKVCDSRDRDYLDQQELLIPMMCARQFSFDIYDLLRGRAVSPENRLAFTDRYRGLTNYMADRGHPEAKDVYSYLCVLKEACKKGHREQTQALFDENPFRVEALPRAWSEEARLLVDYCRRGSTTTFEADVRIADSSETNAGRRVELSFIGRLRAAYPTRKLEGWSQDKLRQSLRDGTNTGEDRVKYGLALLSKQTSGEDSKDYYNTVLELGAAACSSNCALSADEKFSIVMELFKTREVFADEAASRPELLERLIDRIDSMLARPHALKTWIDQAEAVESYLQKKETAQVFSQIRSTVLKKCAGLDRPEISRKRRHDELKKLLDSCPGQTGYARGIRRAIEKEIEDIEGEGYLNIFIENDAISDGWVYFTLTNEGKSTLKLNDPKYYACAVVETTGAKEHKTETGITLEGIRTLRPGYITGERCRIVRADDTDKITVTIQVRAQSEGEDILLSDASKTLEWADIERGMRVDARKDCYKVKEALSAKDELVGRDALKEDLRYLVPRGVTIIYGPSRIGKTSLLNWVRDTLSTEVGHGVISVLCGGERFGREEEYETSILDGKIIDYSRDEQVAEYLLADIPVCGLRDQPERLTAPDDMTDELKNEIVQELSDRSKTLSNRYRAVNKMLGAAGVELWLLLDEFQEVVSRWEAPERRSKFLTMCRQFSQEETSGLNNIKLVLCGSDELLKHFVLKDQSIWLDTFSEEQTISVGPLEKKAFQSMIRDAENVKGPGVCFEETALEALWSYTEGVALYGREICNVVLRDIAASPASYQGRSTIYAFDIAKATQRLLDDQENAPESGGESIRRIYTEVTKKLTLGSDMQYLWFMADWLSNNPSERSFPVSEFYKHNLRDEKAMRALLSIAKARYIIKLDEEDDSRYMFTTLFYYNAFLGSRKKTSNYDPNKIFANETRKLSNKEMLVKQYKEMVNELSEKEQIDLANELFTATGTEPLKELQERYMTRQGDTHIYGDVFNGSTVTFNQIYVQKLTVAMDLLGSGNPQKILEGIRSFPGLGGRDAQTSGEGLTEESLAREINHYCGILQEGYQASDLARQEIRPWEILRVKDRDSYEREFKPLRLDDYFLEQLRVAYHLEMLFDQGSGQDGAADIDYSPVTIMYCKVVEGLLKQRFVTIYGRFLAPCVFTNVKQLHDKYKRYNWKEMMELPQEQQQGLTLGTFAHPFEGERHCRENISALSAGTGKAELLWNTYKDALLFIGDVRNRSAHGNLNERIDANCKNKLVDRLFGPEYRGLAVLLQLSADLPDAGNR